MSAEPTAVALLNPRAAEGQAALLRRPVTAWLARHAPGVSLLMPDSVHHARAMLNILAPRTRVMLIGGDGTLGAMLPPLLRGGLHVGLVPVGHRNSSARTLGLHERELHEALSFALEAPTSPVDVGLLETENGLMHFVAELRLSSRRASMTVHVDGRSASAQHLRQVWVCNAKPLQPPPMDPDSEPIEMNDGHFDVIGSVLPLRWPRWLDPLQRLGPQVQRRTLRHLRGHTIRIDSPIHVHIDADGEALIPSQHLQIDLLPKALDLVGSHVAAIGDQHFVDTTW